MTYVIIGSPGTALSEEMVSEILNRAGEYHSLFSNNNACSKNKAVEDGILILEFLDSRQAEDFVSEVEALEPAISVNLQSTKA
ncbi:hypothetical protein ACQ4M3_39665 [Leptolyngbya sp. AN03gr2]|uniref:hypothetical protein n=1 Tax=unclassified Leptolyngbya TaxID=2650499 RepID=UPI003D30FEDA